MTVSGNLGAGWRDCQRLVTKHLPADRIAISPGNVVTGRKKKERQRGAERGGGEAGTGIGRRGWERVGRWRVRGGKIKRRDDVLGGGGRQQRWRVRGE